MAIMSSALRSKLASSGPITPLIGKRAFRKWSESAKCGISLRHNAFQLTVRPLRDLVGIVF
jgi:hypothetical protein